MSHRTSSMTIRTSRAFLVVLAFQSVASPSAMGGPPDACQLPMFENPESCVGKRPLTVATGDLDGDCDVGPADLAILLGNWG